MSNYFPYVLILLIFTHSLSNDIIDVSKPYDRGEIKLHFDIEEIEFSNGLTLEMCKSDSTKFEDCYSFKIHFEKGTIFYTDEVIDTFETTPMHRIVRRGIRPPHKLYMQYGFDKSFFARTHLWHRSSIRCKIVEHENDSLHFATLTWETDSAGNNIFTSEDIREVVIF